MVLKLYGLKAERYKKDFFVIYICAPSCCLFLMGVFIIFLAKCMRLGGGRVFRSVEKLGAREWLIFVCS